MIILVQSSTVDIYPQLRTIQQQTWAKDSPIPVYYFQADTENSVSENIIKVKSGKNHIFMFMTAVKAFEQALQFKWRYLIKTDNSTYINVPVLKKIIESKPDNSLFLGKEVDFIPNKLPFMWGECFVLSRDLVEYLVNEVSKDPVPKYGFDDIHISSYLSHIKCDKSLPIKDYSKDNVVDTITPVYRCHNESKDLNVTLNNIQEIHNKVLGLRG